MFSSFTRRQNLNEEYFTIYLIWRIQNTNYEGYCTIELMKKKKKKIPIIKLNLTFLDELCTRWKYVYLHTFKDVDKTIPGVTDNGSPWNKVNDKRRTAKSILSSCTIRRVKVHPGSSAERKRTFYISMRSFEQSWQNLSRSCTVPFDVSYIVEINTATVGPVASYQESLGKSRNRTEKKRLLL